MKLAIRGKQVLRHLRQGGNSQGMRAVEEKLAWGAMGQETAKRGQGGEMKGAGEVLLGCALEKTYN